MSKLFRFIAGCLLFMGGQARAEMTVDQTINAIVSPVSEFAASVVFYAVPMFGSQVPLIVVWLVAAALFFTCYFGFINIKGFTHALRVVRGDYSDPKSKGDVTPFQALTAALSGTVGLGNIAGVAVAISIGGPGATFWMIIGGLLGMSSKFVECTLGVKFREINADGTVSGGPMMYLSKGLALKGKSTLGRALAIVFAVCCVSGAIGSGNMFQANQAAQQLLIVTGGDESIFADNMWLLGAGMSALLAAVIIGGIKSIARVTEKVVPLMVAVYLGAGILVLVLNAEKIPSAMYAIFDGAFRAEGVVGGVIGCMIQGFKRAAFANEAGIGSAAIAHSAVKTKEPISEGFVSLLEPFIDTVVICTMTALVIIVSGAYDAHADVSGVVLTSMAFEGSLPWFPKILAIVVFLFAFSTMLTWAYYGGKAWEYLFGRSRWTSLTFKLIYSVFVIVGASMNMAAIIELSDAMIFSMSIANIVGLYILAPIVKQDLTTYLNKVKSGEIVNYRQRSDS